MMKKKMQLTGFDVPPPYLVVGELHAAWNARVHSLPTPSIPVRRECDERGVCRLLGGLLREQLCVSDLR